MYRDLNNIDELFEAIHKDKEANCPDLSTLNRYPIRFVLFDNFRDQYAFTFRMLTEMKVTTSSIQDWIENDYPDILITHQKLAAEIDKHIKSLQGKDSVLTPFSEVARFYDNVDYKEFDALIRTIKNIETSDAAWEKHQRVYIPVVGLEAKMSTFKEDPQIFVWYVRAGEDSCTQRLILTDNTCYGVTGYEDTCYRIKDVKSWVDLWKNQDAIEKRTILCESKSLYAYSGFARPDNAFNIVTCHNVYEFLVKGLQLNIPEIDYKEEENEYWEDLAKEINLTKKFVFKNFVNHHFSVTGIDDYQTLIKKWFENPDSFSRWLLCKYFIQEKKESYISTILNKVFKYNDIELLSHFALSIPDNDEDRICRHYILNEAAVRNFNLPDDVTAKLIRKLEEIAKEQGYKESIKLFSSISDEEKRTAITWLGEGHIKIADVRNFYPDLFDYVHETECVVPQNVDWAIKYIDEYKKSKIADDILPELQAEIELLNSSTVSFSKWYQSLKTTRTLLGSRKDIDVIYWIDGLGIDWINFIANIISEHNKNSIYLNEVHIARAQLPTITSVNKADLLKFLPEGAELPKEGNIDSMAHRNTNVYPQYIVDEVKAVKEAVRLILQKFAGKKIAIVSDHGLTYLAQKGDGLNLGGYDFHHFGRYATKKSGSVTQDDRYYMLEDGKTICSLTYKSVGSKINTGQGAHGGCTPEEILVPVFIVSSSPNTKNWTAKAMIDEIVATKPVAVFKIIGLSSEEIPKLMYNGSLYDLTKNTDGFYESSDIVNLDQNITKFTIKVGETSEDLQIDVNTGTVIVDQFASFL